MNTVKESDLYKMNCLTLVEYVKSSFDIAVGECAKKEIAAFVEDHFDNPHSAEKYETLLRKEEGRIRQHISVSCIFIINIV